MAVCLQLAQLPDLIPSMFVNSDISSGCCCLRFTAFGRPYFVIIDTFVPFENGVPVYAQPRQPSDSFWFCLIEKAYAKLMGGWERIAGNSSDAISNFLGHFAMTDRLTAISNIETHLTTVLKETPLVFASTPPTGNATKHGLSDNHGYGVISVARGRITLMDPRFECQPAGRVFTVTVAVFKSVFLSVGYTIPLAQNWTASEVEYDVSPEMDGRFFAGEGPYVGNLPQWAVTFPVCCPVRIVCIMVSRAACAIGFCMCQNNGNKVSYKSVEDVEFKAAVLGCSYSMKGVVRKAKAPYTLAISRKVRAAEPAHVYCRIEAPCKFQVVPISDPPLDSLTHVTATGEFRPGGNDGASKFAPQWHLEVPGPARLFIRASAKRSQTQHSFFVGVPSAPGRFARPGTFWHEVRIHPDSPFECDVVDISPSWNYVVVGVTRVKHTQASEWTFDLWCASPIALRESLAPAAVQGPLIQAARTMVQTPPTGRRGRTCVGPSPDGNFTGIGVARLYKMMEDL
jgi:hypothetical protein